MNQIAAPVLTESHLRRMPWFSTLRSELQRLVLGAARLQAISAGSTLARTGAVPDRWIGVVQGVLKATACNPEGRACSYVLATSSQWIDGVEIAQAVPRLHDIVAVQDSIVIVIPGQIFLRLLSSSVDFCHFVLEQASHQIRRFHRHVERGRTLSTTALVAGTVAELAHDLLGEAMGSIELNQEDIAEFAGLTRQSVNHILKELTAEGLLKTSYGRVEVKDFTALRQFAKRGVSKAD